MKASDYITLPDVIYNEIPVMLNTTARKAYEQLEMDLLLRIDVTSSPSYCPISAA